MLPAVKSLANPVISPVADLVNPAPQPGTPRHQVAGFIRDSIGQGTPIANSVRAALAAYANTFDLEQLCKAVHDSVTATDPTIEDTVLLLQSLRASADIPLPAHAPVSDSQQRSTALTALERMAGDDGKLWTTEVKLMTSVCQLACYMYNGLLFNAAFGGEPKKHSGMWFLIRIAHENYAALVDTASALLREQGFFRSGQGDAAGQFTIEEWAQPIALRLDVEMKAEVKKLTPVIKRGERMDVLDILLDPIFRSSAAISCAIVGGKAGVQQFDVGMTESGIQSRLRDMGFREVRHQAVNAPNANDRSAAASPAEVANLRGAASALTTGATVVGMFNTDVAKLPEQPGNAGSSMSALEVYFNRDDARMRNPGDHAAIVTEMTVGPNHSPTRVVIPTSGKEKFLVPTTDALVRQISGYIIARR